MALSAVFVTVVIGLLPGTSWAALIVHGDFPAATVDYLMVREDSLTDPTPLFGAPTVVGDTLDFDPVGFGASTTNGGIDGTDGNLAFMVKAHPGKAILNFKISEQGDTTLNVFGGANTATSVTMSGNLEIEELDFGATGLNKITIPISITNFTSGGTFDLASNFGGGPGGTIAWSGSTLVDLTSANPAVAAAFAAQSIPLSAKVTKISVDFDNTMVAISQTGTFALIAKKNQDGIIVTTNIPEPTSCLLALVGLLGLACSRRVR